MHPVQTVWLAIPITSELVQEQQIFSCHSVPQQQPANATVKHCHNRWQKAWQTGGFNATAFWIYGSYEYTTLLFKWLTIHGPKAVIRGSEILMARPRGWKLSWVVVCLRTSFLCGCMDSFSQCAPWGPKAGCFYHSHLPDKQSTCDSKYQMSDSPTLSRKYRHTIRDFLKEVWV